MCMSILLVCMSVHHMLAYYPERSEEKIGCPRTRITANFDCYVGAGNQTLILCEKSTCF